MSICKRCGCEFEYSMKNGTGYAPDLCGAFCDGVYSQKDIIDRLTAERDALAAELRTLLDRMIDAQDLPLRDSSGDERSIAAPADDERSPLEGLTRGEQAGAPSLFEQMEHQTRHYGARR